MTLRGSGPGGLNLCCGEDGYMPLIVENYNKLNPQVSIIGN